MSKLLLLTSSQGLRFSALMIVGNVFAQGISGIAIILLSRIIGPAEFGIFSSGFSLALIIASFIDLGLTAAQQQAIPRATDNATRNQHFATVIFLKTVLFVAVALVILPLSPWLTTRLHLSSGELLFWIVLANFGSIFFNQLAGMLLSLKRVVHAISINTIQALSKLLMVAFIFYFGWVSGAGILLVYLALPLIILPAASLLLPEWYRYGIKLHPTSWLTMRSMALNSWVASFGSVLIQNADIVLVSMLLTPIETGLMGAASRLAIFIALIGGSLIAVLGARVSTYQSEHDLNAYWKKALLIFVSAAGLAIVSFVVSKSLIQLTVGEEYLAAAPVLSWLLAASWLAVGLAPLSVLFYSYDKPWYFSVSVALQTVLLLAGNYVLLPSFGIIAAGWVRLGSQLVIVAFTIGLALYTHRQKFQRLPLAQS